jgi:uncharacterized protein (TIGR03086 family)
MDLRGRQAGERLEGAQEGRPVVHGWDVARCLGVGFEPDPEVLAVALRVAQAVPDGPGRLEPGSAFRPAVAAPAPAGPLDRIVALLGRSPDWPR